MSKLLVTQIAKDGRSNRLEGTQLIGAYLIGAYLIMAASFFFVEHLAF